MEPTEILDWINGKHGFFETYHLHSTYKCIRQSQDGSYQKVMLEIYDAGPNVSNESLRYHAVATSEDGKVARGNPDMSIYAVLTTLHWSELGE